MVELEGLVGVVAVEHIQVALAGQAVQDSVSLDSSSEDNMSNIYCIVQNGVVVNMAIADAPIDATWILDTVGATMGWTYANGVFTAPVVPAPVPPTPAQQAASAIAAGVTINSTSTPAINGLYACDPTTISDISGELLSMLENSTFTNGATAIGWPLASGAIVTFPSLAVFKAWATAIAGYVSACKQFGAGVPGAALPVTTITIA